MITRMICWRLLGTACHLSHAPVGIDLIERSFLVTCCDLKDMARRKVSYYWLLQNHNLIFSPTLPTDFIIYSKTSKFLGAGENKYSKIIRREVIICQGHLADAILYKSKCFSDEVMKKHISLNQDKSSRNSKLCEFPGTLVVAKW